MSTTQITPDLSIVKTEHPSAIRLREGFDAFGRGDLETVRQHLADDCVWTNTGSSVLAGAHRGWDEIVSMFGRLFEVTGGTHAMDLQSVLADDDRAIAVYDSTSTVAGQTSTMRFVMIQEIGADGRATACQLLPYDQAASDAHLARAVPQQR